MTATAIAAAVRAGDRRATDVLCEALAAIESLDRVVGAFLSIDRDGATAAARAVDEAVAAGRDPGPLAGVPVAVKDNLMTRGAVTTAGSRMLAGFVAPYDATVVARLRAAGALVVGKTNLDEFGMGSSCEHSALGRTVNPWDVGKVPGGSSGGSAAAVAAGLVPVALGSDTGGSIRQPAALCGVVGLKPTYGRVSRYGLIAFASSLDQVGPIAATVDDAALVLDAIAGVDGRDATSADVGPVARPASIEGLSIGLPAEAFAGGVEPEVEAAVRAAAARLTDLGCRVVDIEMPRTAHAVGTYYLIAMAEASSNLSRYDGVHYGHRSPGATTLDEVYAASRSEALGAEVRRRILLGTFALSEGYAERYYVQALKVRRLVREDFDRAFETVDLIATPTSPVAAFDLGSRIEDPLALYAIDAQTTPASLAGLPGISVPCGFTTGGLPIGLQLVGPAFEEGRLLAVAAAYEGATEHHRRRPEFRP